MEGRHRHVVGHARINGTIHVENCLHPADATIAVAVARRAKVRVVGVRLTGQQSQFRFIAIGTLITAAAAAHFAHSAIAKSRSNGRSVDHVDRQRRRSVEFIHTARAFRNGHFVGWTFQIRCVHAGVHHPPPAVQTAESMPNQMIQSSRCWRVLLPKIPFEIGRRVVLLLMLLLLIAVDDRRVLLGGGRVLGRCHHALRFVVFAHDASQPAKANYFEIVHGMSGKVMTSPLTRNVVQSTTADGRIDTDHR